MIFFADMPRDRVTTRVSKLLNLEVVNKQTVKILVNPVYKEKPPAPSPPAQRIAAATG